MTFNPRALPISSAASDHLNMIRAVAALAVLVGHIRGLFFVPFPAVESPSSFDRGIYAVTGIGHQAVMVFFVLSGFLISSTVLRSLEWWSWKTYLINRLTRLYVVLVPALLLCVACDLVGGHLPRAATYYNRPIPFFNTIPFADKATLPVFLGNLAFLQGVRVPVFGSNDPLWSLSNEFWYYILFAACLVSLAAVNRKIRFTNVAIAAAVVILIPTGMLAGFFVWCLGAALHYVPQLSAIRGWAFRFAIIATVTSFAFVLALTRTPMLGEWGDYAVGVAFAVLLYVTLHASAESAPAYAKVVGILAGMSYTVYATHFPLLILTRTVLADLPLLQPGTGTLGIGAALALALMTVCWAISSLTEARTSRVRDFVFELFTAWDASVATSNPAQGLAMRARKS